MTNPASDNDHQLKYPTKHPLELYKNDHRSQVWRTKDDGGRAVVVKRFEYSSVRQLLGVMTGMHPAQLEQKKNQWLKGLGVDVVEIVGGGLCFEKGRIRYWLATPYTGQSLLEMLTDESCPAERRQRVLKKVGQLTGQLVKLGVFNRDHKTGNLLVDEEDRVWLIDVGGARASQKREHHRRMVDKLDETLDKAGATEQEREMVRRLAGVE